MRPTARNTAFRRECPPVVGVASAGRPGGSVPVPTGSVDDGMDSMESSAVSFGPEGMSGSVLSRVWPI
jgi:hypothetical protein